VEAFRTGATTVVSTDFLVVDAVLRNRSPKGFFRSNREFIAKRSEKQGLSIAIGIQSCRSVCDFNGIEQG
jgi:hypothetical protein